MTDSDRLQLAPLTQGGVLTFVKGEPFVRTKDGLHAPVQVADLQRWHAEGLLRFTPRRTRQPAAGHAVHPAFDRAPGCDDLELTPAGQAALGGQA